MHYRKFLFICVVSLGVFLVSNNLLLAQEAKLPAGPEKPTGMIVDAEERGLGLSDDQREKLKTLRQEMRTKLEAIRVEMQKKYDAFNAEKESDNPDHDKGIALLKEIASFHEQQAVILFEHIFDIKKIMTPEQYDQYRDMNRNKKGQKKYRNWNASPRK